jgi:AraC-like DNA-binding protein
VADPDRAAPGWLHRVCARVQAQLATPVTLTGLCRLAGVGRSALCAGFRTHYRCTPLAWVTERRLAQACTLLAAGDRTVLDIALACGFGSIATFNRRFARVYGCAPTAWRRRQRSG